MKRWKKIVSTALIAGCVLSAAVSAEETVNNENTGYSVESMIGKTLDFLSTDPDGNRVIGKKLYADNTITVVVLWGTWSPECMEKMPELAEMHERLQGKGCGIVGLDHETTLEGDEAMEAAKTALEESGATFPNAVMPPKLDERVTAYPTAFFVNRDGVVLTTPITGADVGSYEGTVNALLEGTIEAAAEITPGNSAVDTAVDAAEDAGAVSDTSENADINNVTESQSGVEMASQNEAVTASQDQIGMEILNQTGMGSQDQTGTEFQNQAGTGSQDQTGTEFLNGAATGLPDVTAAESQSEVAAEEHTMIVVRNANMRDAPHGNFMRVVPSGTTVKVLGTAGDNNDWYQIEIYGIVGYVYQDLLTE